MKNRFICLLLALCFCCSAALAENNAIWQLAEEVLVPADIIQGEYDPIYSHETILALIDAAAKAGVDTSEFAWLADADEVDCVTAYDQMALAAYGPYNTWSLEFQYQLSEMLYQLGLTEVNLVGLPDDSDMSLAEVRAHAARLLYYNFGAQLPTEPDGKYEYYIEFICSGLNEDDYSWNVVVLNESEDLFYTVMFDREGKILDAANGGDPLTDEEMYFIQMPLAFLPLAEQQRLLGDEYAAMGNNRSMPVAGEATADDVVSKAIEAITNGSGNDLRSNPVTGEEARQLIDSMHIGIACIRWIMEDGQSVLYWDVYFLDENDSLDTGIRVNYIYDCSLQEFSDAWIHDISDFSNG